MIISRTPLRVSFLGGGTDLPCFYEGEGGAALSTTINKFIYVVANWRFEPGFRLAYDQMENPKTINKIKHPIIKSAMEMLSPQLEQKRGRSLGLDILSQADVPCGTGLGSSSSFTVGLLHVLKGMLGESPKAEELARQASHLEIDVVGSPIGKQDQYAAAYGGLRFMRFLPDGSVSVDPMVIKASQKRELQSSLQLFYTGQTRSASEILAKQKENTIAGHNKEALQEILKLTYRLKKILEEEKPLQEFGTILNEGWELKKTLAPGISNEKINRWYQQALEAGAWGGKIIGAGAGGFLLLMTPTKYQDQVREALGDLKETSFEMEKFGSQIVYQNPAPSLIRQTHSQALHRHEFSPNLSL